MASGLVKAVAGSPVELALLAQIAAAPADDLARLVYADWLDEHADAPAGTWWVIGYGFRTDW